MKKIAFLGLGAMGSLMAARLLAAGYSVSVWNRTPAAAEGLVAQGASLAANPAAAASKADVVISMVTDDNAARSVWLGDNDGAINGLQKNAFVLECSTVSPAWINELSNAVVAKSAQFLDAPVAGSRPQAQAGQLVFLVGGEVAALENAGPVLQAMGSNILHLGKQGNGAIFKLAVNSYFAAQLQSMAQMLSLLNAAGISKTVGAESFAQLPIVAPPLVNAAKMMALQAGPQLFTIDLLAKDLGYTQNLAAELGLSLNSVKAAFDTFTTAQKQGLGGENFHAIAKL